MNPRFLTNAGSVEDLDCHKPEFVIAILFPTEETWLIHSVFVAILQKLVAIKFVLVESSWTVALSVQDISLVQPLIHLI